jgi:hypothetical protein
MADLNALIAQGAQFQAPVDPFAQYGKMQQLQQGQQANALNQMKMEEMQAATAERNALRQLNPASPDYESQLFKVNPTMGIAYRKEAATAAAQQATQQAQKAQALKTNLDNHRSFLVGVNDQPSYDAWRTLTAQNIPELASILPAQFSAEVKDSLLKKADDVSKQLTTPTPISNLARLQKELAALPPGDPMRKTYIDAIAKESQFAPTPLSDTARLIKERDALPPGDPNRALYDRQIRDLGASAQNARDRLAFDQSKFNYERANPGKTIKEITQADGSTQVVAIDNRTGMATQVMMAGAPGAAPAGGGRGAVGVTDGRAGPATPLVGAKPSNAQATEGERKAATLLQRLQFSQSQLTQALEDNPDASKPGVFASAVAKLSTPLANTLTPETRQRVESAQLDMLDAALTLGTGAAYTKEQLEGYRQSYFPQIGDGPKQILDKQARLNNVIAAAKIASGRAEKLVPTPPSTTGASDVRSAADKIIGGK